MNCPRCNKEVKPTRTVATNYVQIVCGNPSCDFYLRYQTVKEPAPDID